MPAMRIGIVFIGLGIILFGVLLWLGIGYPIELLGLIGFINIVFGLVTPKSPGLVFQPDPVGSVKLVVDKARFRSGVYELVFSDSKLTMKKLASTTGIFAVGFVFALIGGLVGGLTGYSLGEFLVERKRRRIQGENGLTTMNKGDMEIPYQNMNQVELTGAKLKISSNYNAMTIFMSKKYPPMIGAKLRELIPGRSWAGSSPISM